MRRISIIIILLGFFLGTAQSNMLPDPQYYMAYKTSEKMNIDGKSEESDWAKANWSNQFIDIEGLIKPTYATQVKMLWDEEYFYILAKMEEPHVWANLKQRDTIIFYNNDFEVFIDPDGDTHHYYELELNALNTAWDLFVSKPYRDPNAALNDFDMKGLKSAIYVDGTLNNYKDQDKGWTLEMAIPWSSFRTSYFQDNVPVDQYWRVNFSRVNWDFEIIKDAYTRKKDKNEKYLPEYNWVWSPMGVINMHEPEKWGYVFFSSEEPGKQTTFMIPRDERIRWELYTIYKAQRQYYKKNNQWAESIKELGIKEIKVDQEVLEPKFEVYNYGWNVTVISPFTNKTLLIKENGQSSIK